MTKIGNGGFNSDENTNTILVTVDLFLEDVEKFKLISLVSSQLDYGNEF